MSNIPSFSPKRLLGKELRRMRMEQAYYDELNSDPRFLTALRALADAVHQASPTDTLQPREPIDEFAKKWLLPRDVGANDVSNSIWHSRVVPRAGLKLAPRMRIGRHMRVGDIGLNEQDPWLIHPNQPLPFRYSPLTDSRDAVRDVAEEVARQVKESILEQAAILEAQAKRLDYAPIPPRHANPDELRRMAKRLYRRGVQRMSWKQVADAEEVESGDKVLEESVIQTVQDWSKELKIRLPSGVPGRPRKRR